LKKLPETSPTQNELRSEDQGQTDHTTQQNSATEVSLDSLRCRLFERTEEAKRLEKEIKINAYKDYLLDKTDEDIPTEEYLQPVDESEYQDYFCFNGCGCDAIPERDKRIVNRHHFHYR